MRQAHNLLLRVQGDNDIELIATSALGTTFVRSHFCGRTRSRNCDGRQPVKREFTLSSSSFSSNYIVFQSNFSARLISCKHEHHTWRLGHYHRRLRTNFRALIVRGINFFLIVPRGNAWLWLARSDSQHETCATLIYFGLLLSSELWKFSVIKNRPSHLNFCFDNLLAIFLDIAS